MDLIARRSLLAVGLALIAAPAWPAEPAGRRLGFAVFRNGAHVGEHHMAFAGDAAAPVATTEVEMAVKLGPIVAYRYRHHAVERWTGGRFSSLETTTDANGRAQRVSARRGASGVAIETGKNRLVGPSDASPLTHWNPVAFAGPLFNPQEGKMLKVAATRTSARQWSVRGEAEIDDFYDAEGVWSGLKGRLKDGSTMEYRRL